MSSGSRTPPAPWSADAPDDRTDAAVLTTLSLVAETIVTSLGFGVAVVNLVDVEADEMRIAAVAGPPGVRSALLGLREPIGPWEDLLAASERWGALHFLDHRSHQLDPDDVFVWVPELPEPTEPDGWHPLDALFAPLHAADGQLLGVLSVDLPADGRRPARATCGALEAFAVTAALALEHVQLVARSRRSLRRLQAVFDASPVPVALLDADQCLLEVNDAYCRFLGRPREALVGHDPAEFTGADDGQLGAALARRARAGARSPGTVEERYVLPDGSPTWGRLHVAPLDSEQEPGVVVAVVEDVTERRQVQQRLVRQAHYDALTGLPNRAAVLSGLQATLQADAASGHMTAVFFCDLDRLKMVNDGYGHAMGDAYLREVAARIRAAVRDDDVVGRLGGDEFVVVVGGVVTPVEVIGLAGRIIDDVHQGLDLGAVQLSPSVSIGISYTAPGAVLAEDLLAQADEAMYVAKSTDRGSWHVYDPTSRNTAADQLQLRADVEQALARGELVLHYQPVVRLPDGLVVGHEALLRWQHPERGLLCPADFLHVVLGSEYETPVTDWALRQACLDTVRRSGPPTRVSVNVSSVQIGRRNLPEVVARTLRETGLPAERFVLELTEDRLLSRSDGAELLADLRAVGVSLALDDFGSGWAGLDYLQRFPSLDLVKLDASFTRDLGAAPMAEHIVRSVITLTQDAGLALVVEGVERRDQAERLTALGVHLAQGHLFGAPAPLP